MINHYPSPNRIFYRSVAVLVIGASALSGCARIGNEEHDSNVMQATVEKGIVSAGADLHYDPSVLLDHIDGGSNKCTRLKTNLVLDGKAIVEPIPNDDVNGPWTGLLLSTLPPEIQSECGEDNDSVVWVRTQNVHTEMNPDSFIMIAKQQS